VIAAAKEMELPESGEAIMRRFERQVMLHVVDSLWRDHIDQLDVLRVGIQLRGIAQRDPLVEFKSEAYKAFEQLKEDIEHLVTDLLFRMQIVLQPQLPPPEALPSNLKTNVDAIAATSGQAKGAGSSNARQMPGLSTRGQSAGNHASRQHRGGKGAANGRHGGSLDRQGRAGNGSRPGQSQARPTATLQRAVQEQQTGTATSPAASGSTAKPGRNDPCYCGSGRKYKVCHGR
jgi:preprotein translocase subunit SecA